MTKTMVWFACSAAVCTLVPALAHAQPPGPRITVALDYTAPSGCPDLVGFAAIVTGRLGYDPFREQGPERVMVSLASGLHGTEGRMEWRDAGGKWAGDRTFPSRSDGCAELARAMGFALALQIQFYASSSASDSPAVLVAPASVTTASTTVSSSAPTSQQAVVLDARAQAPAGLPLGPARTRPVLSFGGGAALGFGSATEAVPFGRVFGSLAWPVVSAELGLELGWPSTVRRADGAGVSQQQLLASLAGCATRRRLRACLLAKGGQIRIAGQDIDEPASAAGWLLETGARLGVRQALGSRVSLTGYVDGLARLTRWRVSLDQNQVWVSPRFAETVGIDLGVSLP